MLPGHFPVNLDDIFYELSALHTISGDSYLPIQLCHINCFSVVRFPLVPILIFRGISLRGPQFLDFR